MLNKNLTFDYNCTKRLKKIKSSPVLFFQVNVTRDKARARIHLCIIPIKAGPSASGRDAVYAIF